MSAWREEASKRGYSSCITLPLVRDEDIFGTLTIYSSYLDAFNQEEIELLKEMADDLSFGIYALRIREAQQRSAAQIRRGLEETLYSISATIEMRDPYTAGHQRRVSDLAKAIAKVMGLTEEQMHGIFLGSIVHDLGKISVPAEVLSKPSRLNEFEYGLIKLHPQVGYEILKDVEFPWPIGKVMLQHHERLDGSGYPHGLKGDQIILEARIVAVADVVEAMSSHRPYRPGLGLDAALTEITNKRGIYYDPVVVDACVRLFKEQGYILQS